MSSIPRLIMRQKNSLWQTAILLACATVTAQTNTSSSPLSAEQVMRRVVAMNELRAKALQGYSSQRTYELECHCLVPKKANMVVQTEYARPNIKEFTIESESGSRTVRRRVFKRLLQEELESLKEENKQRSALTLDNYVFRLLSYQMTDLHEVYVLEAEPRTIGKFLFRGHIWVDGKEFAVTQVDGEPAVNPSWWTEKTHFCRKYQKVGLFWLPESNRSVTKVRIFGTAVLTISYRNYQITQSDDATLPSLLENTSNGH